MTLMTFPTLKGLMYPVQRGPVWATSRQRSVSGKVTTLGWYSYPYYRYELQFSVLRSAAAFLEWQELLAFYNSTNGGTLQWLYNDPDDNTATANVIGAGDGSTVAFQLLRTLTGTTRTWSDPVFHPLGTPALFDNGVAIPGANYAISTSGLVTFVTPPVAGHTITWTGTFSWVCRFDEDMLDLSNFARAFWELKKLPFSTEKI